MIAIQSPPASATPASAALAFRRFFTELREAFLEREALFTQIELALLCREHVLVIGPPGTAKSAIASSVLSRIVDEKTGAPSLFAKQVSESTVQTDLIGPVDFKVLTETGRTEYITDDGMLGATFAFLDEVFDGRDMLLRSILNVLHERELKHGKRLTEGRIECAVMTSNRYLSEVLARSPELLIAFADRLSFICYVPKSFARRASRSAMLLRSAREQTPDLQARLTLQQLALLQEAVDQVEVDGPILEGLEMLADELERALQQQVSKLPDYVPTRYFSQRSVVKALWALKAAVVRDRIYRRPDRPLKAEERDLEMLRHFFLLGGPPEVETLALLKAAVDPRERAQLEILRLEHKAFGEALQKILQNLEGGVEREAAALKASEEVGAAEAMGRGYQPSVAASTARALREKLVPGPRYPQNRAPLLTAARTLVAATEGRMARGMAGQGEGRVGGAMLGSLEGVLELSRAVPELAERLPKLAERTVTFCGQALEMVGLSAESTVFEDSMRMEGLVGIATHLNEELGQIRDLLDVLALHQPEPVARLRELEAGMRERVAAALRRRVTAVFQRAGRKAEGIEALVEDSRKLGQLEQTLASLLPGQKGLREELLGPLGGAYARELLSNASFNRIEQFSRAVQQAVDLLRREGISPGQALEQGREIIEARLRAHVQTLAQGPKGTPSQQATFSGEAYTLYRERSSGAGAPDGELAALLGLEGQLAQLLPGGERAPISPQIREALAATELAGLQNRLLFLRAWLTQILTALPAPDELRERAEAERAFDRLVKSRFPLLAMKEGELLRLQGAIELLARQPGEIGASARKLEEVRRSVSDSFNSFSKRLLEIRAAL